MKKPSTISLLLLTIFFWIRPSRFSNLDGTYEQIRFFNQTYNWYLYIPIYYTLLLFSIIEIVKVRDKLKENLASVILISPIILFKLFFIIKMVVGLFKFWN